MLLECDVFLNDDWLDNLFNYVAHSNGFWISGATYNGKNVLKMYDILNQHINGGVAMYATGCRAFQSFMDYCVALLPKYIKEYFPNLPYDFLIHMAIENGYNSKQYTDIKWDFIQRQYVSNKLIYNYSGKNDSSESLELIKNMYKYAVLHKKPSHVEPECVI